MAVKTAVVACLLVHLVLQEGVRAEPSDDEDVLVLTGDNYHLLSTGEWMVEFYAPWCPHCRQFASVWQEFGRWSSDTSVRVAMVDVVEEPMLAGQFMIAQLPTIYHIKDGEVREYDFRDRSLRGLQDFVEDAKWRDVDAIPWFRSPTSSHMRIIGMFFSAAQGAKVIEEYLRKEYEMETWQIFATVAAGTVVTGLAVGGVCVLLGEICSRMCRRRTKVTKMRRPPPPPPSTTKRDAASDEEQSSENGEKQTSSDQQQLEATDSDGKSQDISTGTHTNDTAKQSPGDGKGKGGDGKQDGDSGGVKQRKGTSGSGKKRGKK